MFHSKDIIVLIPRDVADYCRSIIYTVHRLRSTVRGFFPDPTRTNAYHDMSVSRISIPNLIDGKCRA